MQKHSILLVCYSFPPYPGTGGRRWAKLSKYLALESHTIHVINAINPKQESISAWHKDTLHPNIKLNSIKDNTQCINTKNVFFSKIKNKFFHYASKLKTDSNYADQSLWWIENAMICAKDILNQNHIDYLIISCPPYHPLFELSFLKSDYPQLKLVLDYRDIWIIGQKNKGFFSHLNKYRFEKEKQKEIHAIHTADCIFTVANEMSDSIRQVSDKTPVYTITNGYDKEDFIAGSNNLKIYSKTEKINILFAGSLVSDSNSYAIPFFKSIVQIKEKAPDLYARLNICILGTVNPAIIEIISHSLTDCLDIHKPVNSKEIGEIYSQFDYLLLFLNPYYTYAYISKFFDYLPARKPIISISEKGKFSEFLEEHQLGKNFDIDSIYDKMISLLSNNKKIKINDTFNIEQFSYEYLAKKLVTILQKI